MDRTQYILRNATTGDIAQIMDIDSILFDIPFSHRYITNMISTKQVIIAQLDQSKKIIGYSIIDPHPKKFNMTLSVKTGVLPDYQGRGIASEFVKYATNKYDKIICHVRKNNHRSMI